MAAEISSDQNPPKNGWSFAHDQPPRKRREDRLGRTKFSEAIANALISWDGTQSFVLSLTGAWGSGKTAIKNFVVEVIEEAPEVKRPDILEFNPWQIAGRDQLAEAFFHDLGLKLGRTDSNSRNREVERRWRRWAAALQMTSSLTDLVPKNISITGFVTGLALLGLTKVPISSDSSLLFWIGFIFLSVSALLSTSAKAAHTVAKFFGDISKMGARTLDELRGELRGELAKRDRSLVIIIDEIDRLPAEEIKLIFQLVKGVSDFPRLIFLLVFERQTVERAVVDSGHTSGSEYLEKIIQLQFTVPQIDRQRINKIIIEEIESIFMPLPSSIEFDEERWWGIFTEGIDSYITDLRDLNLFINGCRFHAGLLHSGSFMEVNLVDLLAVEILRIFEPRLYEELPESRRLLLEGQNYLHGHAQQRDIANNELEELLNLCSKQNGAKRLLGGLFPQIRWLTDLHGIEGFKVKWKRELRICSDECFDRYFILGVPFSDIPNSEIQQILQESGNLSALSNHFRELENRNQLLLAVDRLLLNEDKIEGTSIENFLRVLFDFSDNLSKQTPSTGEPAFSVLGRFVSLLLTKVNDMNTRADILLKTLTNSSGLYLPCYVTISMIIPSPDGKISAQQMPEETRRELKISCSQKFRARVEDGSLIEHPNLDMLISWWQVLASIEEVTKWCRDIVGAPSGALRLLSALTSRNRLARVFDEFSRIEFAANLDYIEKHISLNLLEEKIRIVDQSTLTDEQKKIVEAFRNAMQAKRERQSN